MTDTGNKPVSIHSYVEIDQNLPEEEQSKQIVDFLSGGKAQVGEYCGIQFFTDTTLPSNVFDFRDENGKLIKRFQYDR